MPLSMFPLTGAACDLWFEDAVYDAGGSTPVTSLVACSRASDGYATNLDGSITTFSPNVLRITDLGLLIEAHSRTNSCLQNRDLTNASWTKTSITAAKDQTGPDGVANSASSILATGANGTALQTITLASSARWQSAYVKRLIGSGTINMTMDNGSTWTAITVTGSWTRVEIPTQTLANPIVGFRIVTNGDKIAVDLVQNEDAPDAATQFASSPIATTTGPITRAADAISAIGSLATVLGAIPVSVVADVKSLQSPSGTPRIVAGGSGGAYEFHLNMQSSTLAGTYNAASQINATIGGVLTWTDGIKAAAGLASGARSIVANAGTVTSDANSGVILQTPPYFGRDQDGTSRADGYFRRFTVWNSKLSDATLVLLADPSSSYYAPVAPTTVLFAQVCM